MKKADREKADALAQLREWIKPGDTVYTILDHVSSSGMMRAIRVLVPLIDRHDDEHKPATVDFRHPNYAVGKALGLRHWKRHGHEQDALVMSGCGMDMGFALVYELSRVLFPEGFGCIGRDCPSNDHSNGDRNRTPHYPEAATCVDYRERDSEDIACAIGVWGERDTWGKRTFTRHDDGPTLYLFDDEIVAEVPAAQHWHRDGGYALCHKWL